MGKEDWLALTKTLHQQMKITFRQCETAGFKRERILLEIESSYRTRQ